MVIWGSNEKDEKILLALELIHDDNKVKIYTFPAASVTEVFYNQMMNLWRNGGPVSFPEDHSVIDRELSMTENLLPAEIRVERTDLINRAKTEWHFVVLSAKLRESYNNEIQDFKEKIESLSRFDDSLWNDLKDFWNKVQNQVREKNLFREHADELRDNTNELFTKLKSLRKSLNEEFAKISKEHADVFLETLRNIEKKVNDGLGLHPIFNELKDIQNKFNNTDFTRSDRSHVWKKLDGAFKLVKEKKFGSSGGKDSNSVDRINKRYTGLMSAIKKMQNSIHRDKKDIEFQNNRIQTTEGQLEMQIRQAKLSMIQERIKSKEDKLSEMLKTKESVEKKLEQEKTKQIKREAQQASAASESGVKSPIQDSNKAKSEGSNGEKDQAKSEENKETIKEAAKEDKQEVATDTTTESQVPKQNSKSDDTSNVQETPDESLLGALGNTIGEAIEDTFDTIKAAAVVLTEKVEDAVDEIVATTSEEE